MALEQTIEIRNTGVECKYLRIADLQFMANKDLILISLEIYKDATSRSEGKQPITLMSVNIENASTVPFSGENLISACYAKIKEIEIFKDAIDV